MFVGLHAGLAMLTGHPEIQITHEEGDAFMAAASRVARHYSVQTTQSTMDWVAFAGCLMSMYTPRAYAIARRMRQDQQGQPPEGTTIDPNGNVVFPFGHPGEVG